MLRNHVPSCQCVRLAVVVTHRSLRTVDGRKSRFPRAVSTQALTGEDEELDEQVAAFLKDQDLSERGFEGREDLSGVVGGDEVDEETAKAYCRDIVRLLRLLEERRDMPLREVKLIVQIDDPTNDEARKMGVEDSRGVSRDEVGAALTAVAAGEVPKDRLALRLLHAEMSNWPFLRSDADESEPLPLEASPSLPNGLEPGPIVRSSVSAGQSEQAKPPRGRDPRDAPQGIADMLPPWVGYGGLYFVTVIPVLILTSVIAILFFSSLK